MRVSSILTSAFCCSIAAAQPSDWHGLYKSVDPLDGGIITLSVSGGAAGGDAVNLRFSDTMIRACTSLPQVLPPNWTGAGPDYSKRGLYLADAMISGNKLVTSEDADMVPIQIYCFAGAADETVDGSPGVEINATTPIEWSFTRDKDGGIIMDGSLFSGENALQPIAEGAITAGGDLTVRFHKESVPTGGAWNGLYTGVDTLDGGLITLSVSDGVGAGAKNLRFSDTFIRACTSLPGGLPGGWEGAGPVDSRRGIYLVDAVADGSTSLVSAGGNADVPVQIYCFAGPNDAALVEGRPGVEFDATLAWTFDKVEGGITMSGSLFTGESNLVALDGTAAVGGEQRTFFISLFARFHPLPT